MFDNRWENWISDFSESPSASSLSLGLREQLSSILQHFGSSMLKREPEFPDTATSGSLARTLQEDISRLSIPDRLRGEIPEAIALFLEYLGETGRLGDAEEWAAEIRASATAFKDRTKLGPPQTAKGVTIKKSDKVSPLGRNDPCPCGSGKKFKKCCMTYG